MTKRERIEKLKSQNRQILKAYSQFSERAVHSLFAFDDLHREVTELAAATREANGRSTMRLRVAWALVGELLEAEPMTLWKAVWERQQGAAGGVQ